MLALRPLLRELTIITKRLEVAKFPIDSEFGWAQREFCGEIERQYNAGRPVRIIVLKARQLGISTATEGVLFNWAFLHPGTNGLVIAHEAPASESLFQKTKLFWDTWPMRSYYTQKYSTRHQMTWLETRSNLQVATAKNVGTGRGSTIHAAHLSEVALYPNPKELMTGLKQTIPNEHGTIIILESTAKGVGNYFHEQWQDAEAGETDFIPLFFPWYNHFEYQQVTGLCTKLELTEYERWLMSLGASYENIQWRRWAIPNLSSNNEDDFMQEYPATADEAFITSGNPIFPPQPLKECFTKKDDKGRLLGHKGYLVEDFRTNTMKFVADGSGGLTIFRAPCRRPRPDLYFVAGDPSMTLEGDPACIQVINRLTFEQVAVWHGRIDPITFADKMIEVGRYYHNAMLCPEVEGGGQGTVATILAKGYPSVWLHRWADKAPGKTSNSYGWSQNWQRKSWSISILKKLIIDKSLKLHDRITFNQLLNYVVRPNGEWGPNDEDSGGHDDAVMAIAICVAASTLEGPVIDQSRYDNVIVDIFNQEQDNGDEFGMNISGVTGGWG